MSNSNDIQKAGPKSATAKVNAGLKRRHAAEKRFKAYGLIAICIGLLAVAMLFVDIIGKGFSAFQQTYIKLDIEFSAEVIDPDGSRAEQTLSRADYSALWKKQLREEFPSVSDRRDRRDLYGLISSGATFQLRDLVMDDPSLIGTQQSIWLIADDTVDTFFKGGIDREADEDDRPFNDKPIAWVDQLVAEDRVEKKFNTIFLSNGDSREPELAGIRGALMGSFFTLLVTLSLSFPIGVAAAVYLEEFAPKNRWTDLIEVNINNLAAVPSIVFGLLGLAVFINFFGLPRSAPLVGGLVLTLMTLPTIIIASRAALKSVPPSIREAALGMGASKMQMVFHHVLPLALPGMLTGTIIGMAQALGETAPLLMIGMIAFIVDVPGSPMDPATVLPVQIFLWADLPERAFVERTSAAIMVLLGFLILMNALAVILRKRFERRW
ncbi:MAG: phosphate ABC transporter permease PstA [Candidatus Competibacteraceae bacterium]|nr:phosphate ABC transporter permease PstA [Candidatus Competibacteraceae bacterium]